ncbi:MAG: glycoside hydrolase family 13 protein [Clostridiales bacterium]|nr:glycoside hydrolase family 13 protein [Clostridiales bacterium]
MFFHASRSDRYRNPFGAQPCDGKVELYFDTPSDAKNVTLCYTYGLYGFSYNEEPMSLISDKEDSKRFRTELLLPHEPGLLFYWFRFVHEVTFLTEDSAEEIKEVTDYYVSEADTEDGSGKVYHEPPRVGANEDKYPYAWQITIYDRDFVTPDRMKGAILYQIFPDRFARDSSFDFEKMTMASPREERIYHEDWYEDVDIKGKPSTGYLACDFFGGSLRGIAEKLPYIKSLGVDILYLNPISEARSSHRYDTADYLTADPILGGNEAFDELQSKARESGITIIMDGVFSHTGADSRYFNKFGRYDGTGAYESYVTGKESPYRSWYNFYRDSDGKVLYDSWWGFPDLPNVNENDLSYRKFIFGKGGVVDTWTRRGAGGIRLDVSDELPDSFIRQMRDTLKKCTDGEGILVGEVWEDASNKCSYGSYRDFLLGRTHDSVMGYTFRTALLEFLNGYIPAEVYMSRMEGYRERYPDQAFYCIMNLVSSHDVPRIFTMLDKPGDVSERSEQQKMKVGKKEYDDLEKMALMALALQVGYVGACSLYYGDEILLEGYKDPFNRRTYPWGKITNKQHDHLSKAQRILALRRKHEVLRTGNIKTLYAGGDVLAFSRSLDAEGRDHFGKVCTGSRNIVLILNRGEEDRYFSVGRDYAEEIKTSDARYGKIINAYENESREVHLPPRSFSFLVF